jgi:2-dehydro-3-deoxy-D-arabinonate dehydratase
VTVQIVRFARGDAVSVGVQHGQHITAFEGVDSIAELLRLPLPQLRDRCEAPDGPQTDAASTPLLAPVDGRTEVWAAGVTYQQSRTARMAESARAATVYDQVYDADRPELFFKCLPWKAVRPGGVIGIRADSTVDVPEPELAVVVNAGGEIVGYTICDDVSSRSIEGENPLYLPQAKIFAGACAIGPGIRPAWEVDDPYELDITLTINRGGAPAWTGQANTSQLHRRLDDLVGYLRRGDDYPDGAILSTGTCLVPELPFTLADGDEVAISISQLGTLTTTVRRHTQKETT